MKFGHYLVKGHLVNVLSAMIGETIFDCIEVFKQKIETLLSNCLNVRSFT